MKYDLACTVFVEVEADSAKEAEQTLRENLAELLGHNDGQYVIADVSKVRKGAVERMAAEQA